MTYEQIVRYMRDNNCYIRVSDMSQLEHLMEAGKREGIIGQGDGILPTWHPGRFYYLHNGVKLPTVVLSDSKQLYKYVMHIADLLSRKQEEVYYDIY